MRHKRFIIIGKLEYSAHFFIVKKCAPPLLTELSELALFLPNKANFEKAIKVKIAFCDCSFCAVTVGKSGDLFKGSRSRFLGLKF